MKKLPKILIILVIAAVLFFIFTTIAISFDGILGIISGPKVIGVLKNQNNGAALIINFDKPIRRQDLTHIISPAAYGEWRFENPILKNHLYKTLVFVPAANMKAGTDYSVAIGGIKGIGMARGSSFNFSFQLANQNNLPDESEITMLDIPMDYQDSSLSCEAASLKMALNFKGESVSENEIMEKVGYDLTARSGNIWGDPYQKFVGNIKGKMCTTGYGVYWEPLAKAASNWRKCEAASYLSIADLTREIKNGNPIVFWGVLPVSKLTNCSWKTTAGKTVIAYKETHVRLAIGFVGPENNPSKIIINDPLSGRLYWPVSVFLDSWEHFNYSAVAVY